jgi:hypothetical protein
MFGINGQGEPERPVSPARGYVRKGHVATLQFDHDA